MLIKRIGIYSIILLFSSINTTFGADVNNYDSFLEVYSSSEGDSEINVQQDLDAHCSLGCPGKKNMEIYGNNHKMNGHSCSGIQVDNGNSLNIEELDAENFHSTSGAVVENSNGKIYELKGNYRKNYVEDDGGVIHNDAFIEKIDATFSNNNANKNGGAICNNGSINELKGSFTDNTAQESMGGAIFNFGQIKEINAYFKNNRCNTSDGGAILNYGQVQSIKGDFEDNYAEGNGGAINNAGTIESLNGNFKGNSSSGDHYEDSFKGGGAIMNFGNINKLSGKFEDNTTKGHGGAISNYYGVINLISDEEEIIFNGNKDSEGSNAIYNDSGVINFEAGNYDIVINDGITGGNTKSQFDSVININQNSNGNVEINNNVSNNVVNMYNGTLRFSQAGQDTNKSQGNFLDNVNFNYYGGSIDLRNNNIQNTNLGNLTLYSDMDLKLDGDFESPKVDTITVDSFNSNDNHINISDIWLMTTTDRKRFSVNPFGETMSEEMHKLLAESVLYTAGDVINSPIYKYRTYYDPIEGLIWFERIEGVDIYNPSILAAPVAAQLGGYLNQLNSYEEAFRKMDMYMLMPKSTRYTLKYRNKYAQNGIILTSSAIKYRSNYGWLRPYSILENVALKNGTRVSNTAYGSFFGFESDFNEMKRGWENVWGIYGGYNGSHQAYKGVGIYQNGGTFGALTMLYKDNFFTGLTVNIGSNACEADTMYGKDNFSMIMGGIASKTGLNFELSDGKIIIQPNYLMSYTFVNTFDYTNQAKVKIKSDLLNAIQISPGIQIAGNFQKGWQPYASIYMTWNIIDKTKFKANDISLPLLSVKPFVMYGVGIRKLWEDKYSGYFQTYVTNGGRNGIGMQVGFRWRLGL